jgi:hypothetical protein
VAEDKMNAGIEGRAEGENERAGSRALDVGSRGALLDLGFVAASLLLGGWWLGLLGLLSVTALGRVIRRWRAERGLLHDPIDEIQRVDQLLAHGGTAPPPAGMSWASVWERARDRAQASAALEMGILAAATLAVAWLLADREGALVADPWCLALPLLAAGKGLFTGLDTSRPTRQGLLWWLGLTLNALSLGIATGLLLWWILKLGWV